MTEDSTICAGIDIGKHKLDVAIHGGKNSFCFANDPVGWRELLALLRRHEVSRVGLEATGGYERGIADALRQKGFSVLVMQPLQVKAFARFHLQRAKNDRLDAMLIAACTAAMNGSARTYDPRHQAWADHLLFIEQIEEDIIRLKTRLEHINIKRLRALVERDLLRLEQRKNAQLALLSADLRRHEDMAHRIALVSSVPGIGERTALALLVHMPELGSVSREQAAALAGLAPFDRDSGTMKGQRHIGGGRARVRKTLYMPTVAATSRWNPALCAFSKRMKARGKPGKLIIAAAARKLLIMANAVLQRGTPWVPDQNLLHAK
jgi:transposase